MMHAMRRSSHWRLFSITLVALAVAGCTQPSQPPGGVAEVEKSESKADTGSITSGNTAEAKHPADSAKAATEGSPTATAEAPAAASHNEKSANAEPPADEPTFQSPKLQPAEAPYEGLTRLSPVYDVWVDKAQKQVVMVGEVCLRTGPLEMLACLKGTKEHESILAVNTQAQIAHAGLLAVGAVPGAPVQFLPSFRPASGAEIEITLVWKDAQGNEHRDRAQSWIHNSRTDRPMEQNWVFGGSGFWVNEETAERHYQAEDGDFICISNFPSAMLDLAVESSASNQQLLFEANTDAIPEKGAKVTMILKPK